MLLITNLTIIFMHTRFIHSHTQNFNFWDLEKGASQIFKIGDTFWSIFFEEYFSQCRFYLEISGAFAWSSIRAILGPFLNWMNFTRYRFAWMCSLIASKKVGKPIIKPITNPTDLEQMISSMLRTALIFFTPINSDDYKRSLIDARLQSWPIERL